eukprot:TRINITY_DN17272_c0_g1_i1.p1 TRINITY_DN17272_c0_g1~~TRINITY_DN17272_c0_g1_i1.p1  ORF type:complete len:253 (+),score=61.27 TRINITY_DN17272_c0_g1_i1:83-841(+)
MPPSKRWEDVWKADRMNVILFIFRCGDLLRLDSSTCSVAAVTVEKCFLVLKDEDVSQQWNPYLVAASSIFIAAKVEDHFRKIGDVANCAHFQIFGSVFNSPEAFEDFKHQLLSVEVRILQTLHFDVPSQALLKTCSHITNMLFCIYKDALLQSTTQFVINIVNDSLLVGLWTSSSIPVVVAAAIVMEASLRDDGKANGYSSASVAKIFEVDYNELVLVADQIAALYETCGGCKFDPNLCQTYFNNNNDSHKE